MVDQLDSELVGSNDIVGNFRTKIKINEADGASGQDVPDGMTLDEAVGPAVDAVIVEGPDGVGDDETQEGSGEVPGVELALEDKVDNAGDDERDDDHDGEDVAANVGVHGEGDDDEGDHEGAEGGDEARGSEPAAVVAGDAVDDDVTGEQVHAEPVEETTEFGERSVIEKGAKAKDNNVTTIEDGISGVGGDQVLLGLLQRVGEHGDEQANQHIEKIGKRVTDLLDGTAGWRFAVTVGVTGGAGPSLPAVMTVQVDVQRKDRHKAKDQHGDMRVIVFGHHFFLKNRERNEKEEEKEEEEEEAGA